MSANRDTRGNIRTGPALRKALRRWLAAEEQPQDRLESVRIAAEVLKLAEEVLEQRVLEARAFRKTWADIAEQVGITRQSAHRRWRHLDEPAEELDRYRERRGDLDGGAGGARTSRPLCSAGRSSWSRPTNMTLTSFYVRVILR